MHDIKADKIQVNGLDSEEVDEISSGKPLAYEIDYTDFDPLQLITKKFADSLIETALSAVSPISDTTTTTYLTQAQLNTAYPSAQLGQRIMCEAITDGPVTYIKGDTLWYMQPLGNFD